MHTHQNMQLVQNKTNVERSKIIQRTLGTLVAARYLKNRGWSLEASLHILAGA